MTVTCTICNADNPDTSEFCEECGIELGDSGAGVAIAPAQETAPPVMPPAAPSPVEPAVPMEPEPVVTADDQIGGGTFVESATAAIPPATLTLISMGQSTDTVIPLQSSPLLLGKFDPALGPIDIDLSNLPGSEGLSRRHSELFYDNGWTVRDLGSTNGVFVRRSQEPKFQPRLQGPMKLEDGDEVAFGNLRFVFRLS
jgi:hypothetical protein